MSYTIRYVKCIQRYGFKCIIIFTEYCFLDARNGLSFPLYIFFFSSLLFYTVGSEYLLKCRVTSTPTFFSRLSTCCFSLSRILLCVQNTLFAYRVTKFHRIPFCNSSDNNVNPATSHCLHTHIQRFILHTQDSVSNLIVKMLRLFLGLLPKRHNRQCSRRSPTIRLHDATCSEIIQFNFMI